MTSSPLLESGPEGNATFKLGIVMILGLLCGLGVILTLKFSKEEPVWANWQLFNLKEPVVLGQSPTPKTELGASSVPPLWSSPITEAPAARRNAEQSAHVQSVQRPAPMAKEPERFEQFAQGENAQRTPAPRNFRRSSGVVQASGEMLAPIERPIAQQVEENAAPRSLFAAIDELDASPAPAGNATPAVSEQPQEFAPAAEDPFAGGGMLEAPARQGSIRQVAGESDGGIPPANSQFLEPSIQGLPPVSNIPQLDPIASPPATPPQAPGGNSLPPTGLPMMDIPSAGIPAGNPPAAKPAHRQNSPAPTFMPMSDSQPIPSALPVKTRKPAQTASPATMSQQTFSAPVAETPSDDVYQVQNGDNYWTISRRFYGSARFFSALAEYNKQRIPDPAKMRPGMYVLVPQMEVLHQNYPQLTGGGPRDPSDGMPPGFFIDEQGQPCYRIGKGDTLGHIAQTHLGRSSRWVQIYGLNRDKIPDGKTLKIGSVLRLPADAAQVTLAAEDEVSR